MNYRERLKQDLPKPPKPLLSVLAVPDIGISEKKTPPTDTRKALRVFEYKLTDNPDAWLVLIAPGCDLEETRENLRGRFGSRLLDVRKHNHA